MSNEKEYLSQEKFNELEKELKGKGNPAQVRELLIKTLQ